MSFDRRIIFEKVGLNISIYVPQKQSANYIKYDYLYINKPSINMKQWRVSKVYVVDENLNILYDFDTQTEWEGAILEKGMPEAIGGYHGNEKNITLHVLLDGKEIDINASDFKKEVFEEVKITNISVLNRYNNPSVDLFKRLRVNIWNKEEYIIENKIIALQRIELERATLTMFSSKYDYEGKELISRARNNHDFNTVDVSKDFKGTSVYNSNKNVSYYELWGIQSGVYVKVQSEYDYAKYPTRAQYISDFRTQNRLKVYFRTTGNYSMTSGEEIKVKSIYKIRC